MRRIWRERRLADPPFVGKVCVLGVVQSPAAPGDLESMVGGPGGWRLVGSAPFLSDVQLHLSTAHIHPTLHVNSLTPLVLAIYILYLNTKQRYVIRNLHFSSSPN